jgi:hypothetical protein
MSLTSRRQLTTSVCAFHHRVCAKQRPQGVSRNRACPTAGIADRPGPHLFIVNRNPVTVYCINVLSNSKLDLGPVVSDGRWCQVYALKMEAASPSAKVVKFYKTTRRNITEGCRLHTGRLENLIPHTGLGLTAC